MLLRAVFLGICLLLLPANGFSNGLGEGKIPISREDICEIKIYKLSLRETVELALSNNFDIQLAKYDIWIARTRKDQSRSIYDTVFQSQVEYQDDKAQQVSLIAGAETTRNNYNFGFIKKLPTGTTLRSDLTNERTDTTSVFATSQLTHNSTGKVSVVQELGRNFFGMQDRGMVKVTLKDIENAQFISLEKIETLVANVQSAYWELVLAQERSRIQSEMVSQAKRLYDSYTKKFEEKLVEKPELIASQANLQVRQNDLLLTDNQVEKSLNQLKFLLNLPETHIQIIPLESFDLSARQEDLSSAIKTAFESRSDFLLAKNEIERRNILLSNSQGQLWPEINLTASLARNGLGDHFKSAIENITDQENPEIFAGLEFTLFLENSLARGELNEAKLHKAKSLITLKMLERKILIQIADQIRECSLLHEVALNNDTIAQLQTQKLSQEEIRLNQGRSSTDILIRYQEDLIQSRLLAAESKYQFQLSLIYLDQRKGILLKPFWPQGADFPLSVQ